MPSLQLVSPQAMRIYNVLTRNGALTAKEIGECLNILPHAVYRASEQLVNLGVVRKTASYPVKFESVPAASALGWFLLDARKNFRETFVDKNPQAVIGPTISFIRTRADLLRKTDADGLHAKKCINLIVSHAEVPDEVALSYRKAVMNGVIIRALVQTRTTARGSKLETWHSIGAQTRYTADLGIRMFTFDARIAHFTSYSEGKREAAFGIRFDYAPLAVLIDGLFEERWKMAGDFRE